MAPSTLSMSGKMERSGRFSSNASDYTTTVSNPNPNRATFGKTSPNSYVKKTLDTSYLHKLTFGRPNRPSTPIYGVMTHAYGREYELAQAKAKAKEEAQALKEIRAPIKPQHTKASLGHVKNLAVTDKPRFVMARFKDTSKKVVTQWEAPPKRRGQPTDNAIITTLGAEVECKKTSSR